MQRASRTPATSHLLVFGVLVAALVFLHIPYLAVPYFWDELGQFVPAALDILRDNAWVPHSTVPNVHPPEVMAYLALVWRVFGYSIVVTRVAMLLVAALGVYATFLLTIRLCRDVPGVPAFIVVGLLIVTPLFYTQSMMAQLDMPAMTLTALALVLFFDRKYAWCVVACTALVLAKETGAVLPAVFAGWLAIHDRNWKQALWFALPFAALGAWLIVLWRTTGNPLGDPGFAHYNIGYQLHPVRFISTLLRRFYYLFFVDFRWIGTIAIVLALRKTRFFSTWEWKVVALFAAAQILVVSAFGGAALERYLLPVFPVLYVGMATGWAAMNRRSRNVSEIAVMVGLFAGLYWNPPFPFPLENNLAMIDFVELQKAAAGYLDRKAPNATVASAWPYTGALRNPDLGFVNHAYHVIETTDFHAKNVLQACRGGDADILIVYSRTWEPKWGVFNRWIVDKYLRRYYDYEPQISSEQVQSQLGMRPVLHWEQRGQWIEIFARAGAHVGRPTPQRSLEL